MTYKSVPFCQLYVAPPEKWRFEAEIFLKVKVGSTVWGYENQELSGNMSDNGLIDDDDSDDG